MFCPKCGAENEENSWKCVKCDLDLHQEGPKPAPVKIENYLVTAIVVTILCCLPFGIVAIVYAAQVNGKIQAGDIHGAQESANKAKMWSWISFGTGIVVTIIYVILGVIGAR